MGSSASYRLGEVDRRDADVLPLQDRQDLLPGDIAWLDIEFNDHTESLQAEIEQVLGPGWYLGRTQDGAPVEFGAEHVFSIGSPRSESRHFNLGAPWYDYLPGVTPKKPVEPTPRKRAWYDYLPGTPPPPPGSRSEAAPPPPPQPQKERGSFFDFFKRKPKVEIIPIPPSERRREQGPVHRFRLPFSRETEEVQEAQEVAPEPQAAAQAPPQALILPRAQATLPRPSGVIPALPDDLFEALAPSGASLMPVSPPPQASLPQGMIVMPQGASLPAQEDLFSVLGPAAPAGSVPTSYGPPAEIQDIFNAVAPEAPAGGLVVRPSQELATSSLFDALGPVAQPMAPYEERQAPPPPPNTLFTPESVPQAEAPRAPAPRKTAKKKQGVPWHMPTHQEWVAFLGNAFNLKKLWDYIRDERESEYFLEAQLNEENGGEPPTIPVETWADSMDWEGIFGFFKVPESVWGPYADRINQDDYQDAWEMMNQDLLDPISDGVEAAFKSIKPSDLYGNFVLGSDDSSTTWGIVYYERLDPARAHPSQKEELARRDADDQAAKAEIKHRKAEVKRIWGAMPTAEDIVPWVEERFDVDAMFRDIKKERKTKRWKEEQAKYGEGTFSLETVADLGPKKARDYEYDIAAYFGVPPDIVTLYEDSKSSQELWTEIFWPFFKNVEKAFGMLLPSASLPGRIEVDEDETDHLVLQYMEEEGE